MSLRLQTAARTRRAKQKRKIKTDEDDDLLTIARALSHRPTPRCIANGKCFET